MERLVLGLFDNLAAVNEVQIELKNLNIPSENVHVTCPRHAEVRLAAGASEQGPAQPQTHALTSAHGHVHSFWGELLDTLGISDHARHPLHESEPDGRIFSEGINRGSVLVAVDVDGERAVDQVENVFERFGAIDIDERSRDWGLDGHGQSPAPTQPHASVTAPPPTLEALPPAQTAPAHPGPIATGSQPAATGRSARKRRSRVYERHSEVRPMPPVPEARN